MRPTTRRRRRYVLTVLAAWALAPAAAESQSVALDGPENGGQGIARRRGINECFVLAPLHVVEHASSIEVISDGGARTAVGVRERLDGIDVAILEQVKQTGRAFECQEWSMPPNLRSLLETGEGNTVLRQREENGEFIFIPVSILRVGSRNIIVRPQGGDHLRAGMSGSQLMINGAFSGMLMKVEESSGEGHVLRGDVIDRAVNGFFNASRNREPDFSKPPMGTPVLEPNLWLRRHQTVILGDRDTSFGVIKYRSIGPVSWINVQMNEREHEMQAGTRLPFVDSRGNCHIVYMGTDDPDASEDTVNEKHGFTVVCSPK